MKIKENYIRAIIKEELANLVEGINNPEESKIAHITYILLGKAREKFEDHLGNLPQGEEPSDEFRRLFDTVSKAWEATDKILTGGETPKEFMEPLQEKKVNESLEGTLLALNKLKGFLKERLEAPDYNKVNSWIVELGEELRDALETKARIPGGWRAGEEKPLEPSERSIPPSMGGPPVRFVEEQKDKTK